ncbi:MAG: beta-propeller fold lactonase family protein [Thermoleophilaceae bacterium]
MRRLAALLPAVVAACALAVPAAAQEPLRDVVFVANAEGGTVTVVDAETFEVVHEIDVLPDGPDATLGEDAPLQALVGQRVVELAGGKNYAQDQDVSPDGRTLYVSRGHRGDVAAFDIASGRMLWKLPVNSLRADHMTLSGDGRRLYVSALTSNRVQVVDTQRRAFVGEFPTGEWPHDNHLSHDGERIYNASIGNIVIPPEMRALLAPLLEPYVLTVVDAQTLAPRERHVFDAGIRPFVLTGDETRMYAQLSLFHGIVEYDLEAGRPLRQVQLPIDPGVTEDDFDFEAPHHGLALSPDGGTLCAAGRASDYVALVSTATMQPDAIIDVGDAPGWAANGPGGSHCFVPNTREGTLSVISYAGRAEVARVPVGHGPKHLEAAQVPESVLAGS